MGFQSAPAFQTPSFQPQLSSTPAHGNGHGHVKKKEPTFYDLYTGRKTPPVVAEAIAEVVSKELLTKKARKKELVSLLPNIEARLLALYLGILEDENIKNANRAMMERMAAEQEARRLRIMQEDDQMIILLLLNSY